MGEREIGLQAKQWMEVAFGCHLRLDVIKTKTAQILAYGTSLCLKVIGILRLQEISTMDKGIADGQ